MAQEGRGGIGGVSGEGFALATSPLLRENKALFCLFDANLSCRHANVSKRTAVVLAAR